MSLRFVLKGKESLQGLGATIETSIFELRVERESSVLLEQLGQLNPYFFVQRVGTGYSPVVEKSPGQKCSATRGNVA